MTDELDQLVGSKTTDGTHTDATDDTKDDELLQAVLEALKLAEVVSDTEEVLEEQGIEAKGARAFSTRIRALADSVNDRMNKAVLEALAVVVARAKPEEWSVLATILKRVAPKNVAEKAAVLASKMESEGRVGYTEPQNHPKYPEPGEKAADDTETHSQSPVSEVELKQIVEQMTRFSQALETIGQLADAVAQLQEQMSAFRTMVARETKAYPPGKTRPAAETVPPAAALLGALTGKLRE